MANYSPLHEDMLHDEAERSHSGEQETDQDPETGECEESSAPGSRDSFESGYSSGGARTEATKLLYYNYNELAANPGPRELNVDS